LTHSSKTEWTLQVAVVKTLREHGVLVFSVPNERNSGVSDMARLRASGLTKGAPDLVCWTTDGQCWWLELKAPKGVRSQEQKCFESVAQRLRIKYILVRNLTDIEVML